MGFQSDRGLYVAPGVRRLAFLGGLRWELPDTGVIDSLSCNCVLFQTSTVLEGDPSHTYQITFRFRGVVELTNYAGGTNDGAFLQIGGTHPATPPAGNNLRNEYKLIIGNPQATYFLNRMANVNGDVGATDPFHPVVIDYTATIPIQGGSLVTLIADPIDGAERLNKDANGNPWIVPGVPPYPAAYDGQFCQLDIVAWS